MSTHIVRSRHRATVETLLQRNPVVAILGARQVGKTTLSRELMRAFPSATRFDLEDPDDLARLEEPKLALAELEGLVVIDEVQRRPELFPVLRVLVDRAGATTRFLILGSASPELLRQSSESLAGRIAFHYLEGFKLDEVAHISSARLWLRGGFPRAFLAESDAAGFDWSRGFIATYLERDLPQLGFRTPAPTLHRFWRMLAHYHGQVWNGAELARAFGISASSVRRYLDMLASTFVVQTLAPWFENLKKRQVKAPKIYIADAGILHCLLGIDSRDALLSHPKVGASWEGFVLDALRSHLGARPDECFFWATHAGAELDLLVVRGSRRLAFEIKRTTAPKRTRSMHAAMMSLCLERLDVIHAGEHSFPMGSGIRAVAFSRLHEEIPKL